MTRDPASAVSFVELTDILVDETDLAVSGYRLSVLCAELLDVHATGLLAQNADGVLTLVAASERTAELLTRFELAYQQGPGADAFRTGDRVECVDLCAARLRWPRFAPVAKDAGVTGVYGLPCRLRGRVVGALTLYTTNADPLSMDTVELSRGLANTVSLGMTARRGQDLRVRAEQLQGALESRVLIEQAKGVLAERASISIDEAFLVLRRHARKNGAKLRDVARDVLAGDVALSPPGVTDRRHGPSRP